MSNQLLPTFIIGGSPRSGTTFLGNILGRHPQVRMAQPYIPEPKVFMGPSVTPEVAKERYRRLFEGSPKIGEKARGEKTSYYLEYELACQRIKTVLPGIKIVFILREPVSRAYSNYLWTRKNGLETLSFEEALEFEGKRPNPLPPDKEYARPFDYLCRGNYAPCVDRYYQAIGREKVLILLYENIEQNPERLCSQLQKFIQVDEVPFQTLNPGVINSACESGPPISRELELKLRIQTAPWVSNLAGLTGLDLSIWDYEGNTSLGRKSI